MQLEAISISFHKQSIFTQHETGVAVAIKSVHHNEHSAWWYLQELFPFCSIDQSAKNGKLWFIILQEMVYNTSSKSAILPPRDGGPQMLPNLMKMNGERNSNLELGWQS